tara:strand:+ start:115 stop:351 length:237 start_codon:yes stop_codon:yes gene_type:complete
MEDKIENDDIRIFDSRLLEASQLLCYLENAKAKLMKESKALYDSADFSGCIIRQAQANAFDILIKNINNDEFTFENYN